MGRVETSDATDASDEDWFEPVAWTPPETATQADTFQDTRFDPRRAIARPVPPQVQQSWAPTPGVQTEPDPAPKPSVMARFRQRSDEDATIPNRSNRKPFLMGLLTGVVLTVLLGQIFRATQPAPTYLIPSQTTADYGTSADLETDPDLP